MKKYFLQMVGLTLITGTLLFNSCTDDTTGGGGDNDVAPQVSLVAESDIVSDDAEMDPKTPFKVKLRTTPGSNQIKTIEILEEGVKLPVDRFKVVESGDTLTSNNPLLVVGTSKGGSVYEIIVTAHAGYNVTKRYTFEVTDDNNLTDEVTIDITTKVIELSGKLLLNQAGPEGQGGLDLDTGKSVEGEDPKVASYKEAEINDEGINTDLALDKNWRQRISAVGDNGASIRYPGTSMPENFDYANVTTYDQAKAAYDSGKAFTAADPRGGSEKVSEVVKVGDVFLVKRDSNYYIIKVTKINVTPADNKDSYEFSIKRFYS